MTELEQAEQLDLMEKLKEIEPTWRLAGIEPFEKAPDSEIRQPIWGKPIVQQKSTGPNVSGGEGVLPGTQRVICAVWNGSTFVPKIMIPVEGTLFEDP